MNFLKNILLSLFLIIASTTFVIASAGIISSAKIDLIKVNIDSEVKATSLLLRLIGSESAIIGYSLNKDFSMASLGFELLTNVKFHDIRSLIRHELPGFYSFDSEILIAGEGTDYTDIPIESSPPVEVLLRERNMAAKELAELQKDSGQGPISNEPGEKRLFIYHTHSWESYFPLLGMGGAKDENDSVDGKTNITIIGQLLGQELAKRGIGATVDQTNVGKELKKRAWDTSKSYDYSRSLVQSAMASNQKLKYFIDLHRDSLRKKATTIEINGMAYARIVFVIGKDHKNYEQNLKLANELHEYLRVNYPGLSKGVMGKSGHRVDGVYNQDLSPNAIVVEIGGVDNNMKELKNSVEALANAIHDYLRKAEEVQAGS